MLNNGLHLHEQNSTIRFRESALNHIEATECVIDLHESEYGIRIKIQEMNMSDFKIERILFSGSFGNHVDVLSRYNGSHCPCDTRSPLRLTVDKEAFKRLSDGDLNAPAEIIIAPEFVKKIYLVLEAYFSGDIEVLKRVYQRIR